LSGRERQVAELIADRMTNREIAGRLVLSEKTVERHLSRIFVKLELSSRVQLARMVEGERVAGAREWPLPPQGLGLGGPTG
jgi:DNA-binding NarL/FixJ family response regulator